MDIKWILPDEDYSKEVKSLADSISVDLKVAQLLVNRGVKNFQQAKSFFRPELSELHDPYLMKDMDIAVDRILQAIDQQENIMVFGDYDVDGTTSVAMMYDFISKRNKNTCFYIPDRYNEGYGVSKAGIDFAADNDVSLIICLDCGIKANEKVAYAKEKGVEFIICDHHTPGESLPLATAILDPKRTDCNYPYKELSACGVGFKLIQAILVRLKESPELAFEYLDLCAISIAADIVPITLENRALCYHGLIAIEHSKKPGIQSLLQACKINGAVTVTDIGFGIGPRINAAGRMNHGQKAVELLISDNVEIAEDNSDEVEINNEDRKKLEKEIFLEACDQLLNDPEFESKKAIVVYSKTWHKGVVGIVASRLVEKFYKPTIVLTYSKGHIAGSARSVKGFSIYHAIDRCTSELTQFGGHKYAAGLTLEMEQLDGFMQAFEQSVSEHILPEQLRPEIEIEQSINFSDITPKFLRILKQFEPFGPENPSPTFYSQRTFDVGGARLVGEQHLKLELMDTSGNNKFPAIAFKHGEKMPLVLNGQEFKTVYTVGENTWKGKTSTQLIVQDIKL